MTSEASVSISITDKATAFVKSKRLTNPLILANLCYRSESGGGGGDSCGGGGCGEGDSGPAVPYLNAIIVDGGKPGGAFVRVDTEAGIPVYLAKTLHTMALRSGNPLIVTVKGLVLKRLALEGLDLTSAPRQSSEGNQSCH